MKLDKIFVLNHSDFVDRRKKISDALAVEQLEFEIVDKYHPDEIDYEKELIGWEEYKKILIRQPYNSYVNFSKKISIGSLSLVLKHLWCYREQVSRGYEHILILEDDCSIQKGFKEFLEKNFNDFISLRNENVGMLMLGSYENFVSKAINDNKSCYYSPNQKTRCTHAYIINMETAKKLIRNFKPINLPIDFKLNEIIEIEDIKVAWSEPGLPQNDKSRTKY